VCILWWEESEIFWVVGGKWSFLCVGQKSVFCGGRKVRYFGWWEESLICWCVRTKCGIVGCWKKARSFRCRRNCDILVCETKLRYFGGWEESVYFVVA